MATGKAFTETPDLPAGPSTSRHRQGAVKKPSPSGTRLLLSSYGAEDHFLMITFYKP